MPGAGTGKRVRVAGAAPEFGVLWIAHKLRLVLAPVEEERKHSARAEHGRALDTRTLPVAASTCMVALFIHCATKTTVWACKRGREGVVYSQGSSPPSPLYIHKEAKEALPLPLYIHKERRSCWGRGIQGAAFLLPWLAGCS